MGWPCCGLPATPRSLADPISTANPFSYAGGISLGSHTVNRSPEGLKGTNLPRFTAPEPLACCCQR